LVIDQPGSIAQPALAVARARAVPVAYGPGLLMCWAADLCPAKRRPTSATLTSSLTLAGLMFLVALASLRSPDSKVFYDRKRSQGKRHNAGVICLARRCCHVIVAMLRSGHAHQSGYSASRLPQAA
jgi:hypothetical protein